MRKLNKSELKRVYGGKHSGESEETVGESEESVSESEESVGESSGSSA